MNKRIIYMTEDGHEFCITVSELYIIETKKNLVIEILGGNNTLFLTSEEVDELCELLKEKKKEIWKKLEE